MEPRHAEQPSASPRAWLREGGLAALARALRRAGYVPAAATLNDLGEALTAELPLLIEGPRGAGKTALPEALARVCNLNLFYVQCLDGLSQPDILGAWDAGAQTRHVQQALLAGRPLQEAQAASYTRDFFQMGEALAAYATPGPPAAKAFLPNGLPVRSGAPVAAVPNAPNVLVIDEIDKLDARAEDMFLGLLGRGSAQIPRLQPSSLVGLPPGQEPPVVILTSNNMRGGVSGPLRSRCLYTFIPLPTPAEEVTILKTQEPLVPDALLGQYVKALAYIRQMPNISPANKPGLRESIALLRAFQRKGLTAFTADALRQHIGYLAKQETDRVSLLNNVAAVTRAAHLANAVLDAALAQGLREYRARSGQSQVPSPISPKAKTGVHL